MKKIVLVSMLLGSAFANNATAQSFITEADTVRATAYTEIALHNNITNTSAFPLVVTWKVKSHDFPASWVVGERLGICDNASCRNNNANNDLLTKTYTSMDYAPNVKGDFHIVLTAFDKSEVVSGTHYMTITLKDGASYEKDITFIVGKFATGVSTVNKSADNVVIYPNPAQDNLNVVFDGMDVKNIGVYNLIGKAVSYYKVSGTSAKLDLSTVPSGIYFIRLTDTQGRVVATRKFTHQ